MKILVVIRDSDVFDGANNLDNEGWRVRYAARAVVFGENNCVYLLKMATQGYHKLPGGGVNEGESLEDAVYRELLEEIGCPAKISSEVGEIIEYRNNEKMEQYSYCFIAHQSGQLTDPSLEEREIIDGAEMVIATSIDEAIDLLENDDPTHYGGNFIRMRDLRFLREAASLVRWS